MALLEGRNLRKTYRLGRRNTVEALRGVDISLEAGEMVAIMGPSGSGKSTLMHLLGLLHGPDRNGGPPPEVLVDGRSVANLSDRERTKLRASTMGFVFQAFNLVPTLTAMENVALAGEYAGMKRGQANDLAREALGWVGLAERADHRPMELSGGEQQRVAIARALVTDPSLVLADEPTGNLDRTTAAEVGRLLLELQAELGTLLIVVTHSHDLAGLLSRRVELDAGVLR